MRFKKITSKKLENGDTFATKIEDKKSPYFAQYLVFICFKDPFWLDYWPKNWYNEKFSTLFRIKITTNGKIPKNKEEIDDLEFIISKAEVLEFAHHPLLSSMTYEELIESHSFQKLYPDEFGFLNHYLTDIFYSHGDSIPEFEYLGNFEILKPENEFISFGCNIPGSRFSNVVEETIERYEKYNKRNFEGYNRKISEEYHIDAQEFLNLQFEIDEKFKKMTDEEKKNFHRKYISGWGVGLYDCDVALDTKAEYLEVYDVNKSIPDIMNQVLPRVKDFIDDQYDGPIAWMVLADLQMKRKKLDKRLRDTALDCIEIDLSYWLGNNQYKERKKELYKLKKRLKECKIVRRNMKAYKNNINTKD